MSEKQKTRLDVLNEERAAIKEELIELYAKPDAEWEDPDTVRFAALEADLDATSEEHERLSARAKRIDQVRASAADDKNRTAGDGDQSDAERWGGKSPEFMNKKDPFDFDMGAVTRGQVPAQELQSRALTAVADARVGGATDKARSAATELLQSHPEFAVHALHTGSPAYARAIMKYLRNHDAFSMGMLEPDEEAAIRAALSTTNANGGYTLPFLLDPSIIYTGSGAFNPLRQTASIKVGTVPTWHGVASSGVTAYAVGEGVAMTGGEPTFSQPTITAYKHAVQITGSYEVWEDSNLAAEIPGLVQRQKNEYEAVLFTTGAGGGTAVNGIVTALSATTASRVTATTGGTFSPYAATGTPADLVKLLNQVPAGYQENMSWLANHQVFNQVRIISPSGSGSSFWATLGAGQPEQLLGAPALKLSAMTSTVTTGSSIMIAGDLSGYGIYDRLGMTVEYVPNVVTSGNLTGQRIYAFVWRAGGDVLNANALRIMNL